MCNTCTDDVTYISTDAMNKVEIVQKTDDLLKQECNVDVPAEERFSGLYASASLNDEESAFEYVEAVLLASDLNIHDFRERWLSSDPILDPSLFNDVELFSSRSSQDQKLLFDCTNEVLEEACDGYFGYFPRVSFVKHNVRLIPRGMDLIHEIWNRVDSHLLEEHSPRTLDHNVEKALRNDGKWVDLRFDVESIGFEIGEFIFEELVKELLSSFPYLNNRSSP